MAESVWMEDLDGVRVLHLNRPSAKNAVDLPTARLLSQALEDLDADATARVGVLAGDHGFFSAGMDLKAFRATGERPVIPGKGFGGLTERPPVKPLIAAVEGFAFGGGFEMALACDLMVVDSNAVLGLPEVRRGVVAAGGGLLRLPRLLPKNVANELLLTGNSLSAERAYALGLAAEMTAPGGALVAAVELARVIAGNAPFAVQQSKRVIRETEALSLGEAFDHQRPLTDAVLASDDAREGAAAFLDKRYPVWTGS